MSRHPTGPSALVVEDLLAVVAERFGLEAPITARRLTGGYANDVFLLEGHDLVAHVKHPPANLESLAWEHRLLRLLADRLPEVPLPLPDRSGATFFLEQDQPVWLTPFMQGSPAQPSDRRLVGALGRLHATQIDLPTRPGHARLRDLPIPPLREMPPRFDSWLDLIAKARTDLIRLVSDINRGTRQLAVGVTHNDIFPGNVLVQNGSVTALLDWEEADVDWLVWDLAMSLWPFCDTADWRRAITDFVTAYRGGGGRVPAEDDDLILPLVRGKRILEVLRAPTDRHPRWDLQLANLEAYQALA